MTTGPGITFGQLAESREFADFFTMIWELTGTVIALVDPRGESAEVLFAEEMLSPVCQVIRATDAGRVACERDSRRHTRHALRVGRPEHYLCHAGLVDFVVPVRVEGHHVATIEGGQLAAEAPCARGLKDLVRRTGGYGVDPAKLRTAYFAMQPAPAGKIRSIVGMVHLFAKYFSEFAWQLHTMRADRPHPAVGKAMAYVAQHQHTDIRLADVAQEVGLTPSYFSALFSREAGLPLMRYVQRTRLERAKKLLRGTRKTVTEIALDVGFNNVTHFNHVFRSWEGTTPSEYRHAGGSGLDPP
ncbi:MAG: PocR ligand-binding domain-containing protein [Kiritimatiellae bacterium]|nr:PocR ligand-binding domain-containing protein [Kiritimatiellia bacterium]